MCGDPFAMMKNEDTIDSYILKFKQVASLLNYGEPEILELFKNTLPSKLYWILFPINNLRQAIDTAKRVMNKEKLDKQLTGQASNISPFMKLRDDTHSGQQKMLNPQDLEAISSIMYNMSLQQGKTGKQFKPQVYQKRGRGQRQSYDRDRSRNNSRQEQSFGQNRPRNNYRRNGYTQNFSRNNSRNRGRNINSNYSSDRSRSRERRLSPKRYNNNNNRQIANSRFRSRSRSRSNSRIRTNRDRVRCYRCREYDHYVNECQNAVTSDSEGHESDNAALQIMATDMESDDMRDIDRYAEDTEYLNLQKVRMVPPHFYQKDKKVEKLDLVRKSHIFPIKKEHV